MSKKRVRTSSLGNGEYGTITPAVAGQVSKRPKPRAPLPEDQVREATALAALSGHPHVVRFISLQSSGCRFHYHIRLERMEENLREFLIRVNKSKGVQPASFWMPVLEQILKALAATHDLRLAHCDLKPENVLITNGLVKVCDFGLARTSVFPGSESAAAVHYRPPELLAPDGVMPDKDKWPLAPASTVDLWSFGILVLALCGRIFRHVAHKQELLHLSQLFLILDHGETGRAYSDKEAVYAALKAAAEAQGLPQEAADNLSRSEGESETLEVALARATRHRFEPHVLAGLRACLHIDPSKRAKCARTVARIFKLEPEPALTPRLDVFSVPVNDVDARNALLPGVLREIAKLMALTLVKSEEHLVLAFRIARAFLQRCATVPCEKQLAVGAYLFAAQLTVGSERALQPRELFYPDWNYEQRGLRCLDLIFAETHAHVFANNTFPTNVRAWVLSELVFDTIEGTEADREMAPHPPARAELVESSSVFLNLAPGFFPLVDLHDEARLHGAFSSALSGALL